MATPAYLPPLRSMVAACGHAGVNFRLFNKIADDKTVTFFAVVGASFDAVHLNKGAYGRDYFVVECEEADEAFYLAIKAWNDLHPFGDSQSIHVV